MSIKLNYVRQFSNKENKAANAAINIIKEMKQKNEGYILNMKNELLIISKNIPIDQLADTLKHYFH